MPDMLKIENLKKNFGELEVLRDISLTVKVVQGFFPIISENGFCS